MTWPPVFVQPAPGWRSRVIATVSPFTMIKHARIVTNVLAVAYVLARGIPGDFVEAGVAAGGSAASIALTAVALGGQRRLHLFDTFAGMPPANASVDSASALAWTGRIKHGVEEVKRNLVTMGVDLESVQFHAGDIVATPLEGPAADALPRSVALLCLDTDWYASYTWEFAHLFPLVSPGGIVLLDDYSDWPGARLATQEFLARPENAKVRFDSTSTPAMMCVPLANGDAMPCGEAALRQELDAAAWAAKATALAIAL